MNKFNSRLGLGDMIYFVNSKGDKHPYIIGQILFSGNDIEYRNHIGTRICHEWELDNIQHGSNRFYFTSKIKRDKFIEMLRK